MNPSLSQFFLFLRHKCNFSSSDQSFFLLFLNMFVSISNWCQLVCIVIFVMISWCLPFKCFSSLLMVSPWLSCVWFFYALFWAAFIYWVTDGGCWLRRLITDPWFSLCRNKIENKKNHLAWVIFFGENIYKNQKKDLKCRGFYLVGFGPLGVPQK